MFLHDTLVSCSVFSHSYVTISSLDLQAGVEGEAHKGWLAGRFGKTGSNSDKRIKQGSDFSLHNHRNDFLAILIFLFFLFFFYPLNFSFSVIESHLLVSVILSILDLYFL